jgi:serine/threonine protein kinase
MHLLKLFHTVTERTQFNLLLILYMCAQTNAFFKIGRGEQPPIPNYLSREARDFITQCVRVDPDDRPSAVQLLEHPFVKRPLPLQTSPTAPQLSPSQADPWT